MTITQVRHGQLSDIGMVKIASTVLGAPAASVVFSSIPQTYSGLHIIWTARNDTASQQSMAFQINGDSGLNYDGEQVLSWQTSTASATQSAQSALFLGFLDGTNVASSSSSSGVATLPFYAGTTFWKNHVAHSFYPLSPTPTYTFYNVMYVGEWRNTAAITSLTIFSSSGNLVAGSSIALYGMP